MSATSEQLAAQAEQLQSSIAYFRGIYYPKREHGASRFRHRDVMKECSCGDDLARIAHETITRLQLHLGAIERVRPGIMNEWFSTYLPILVVPERSKLIAAISEP